MERGGSDAGGGAGEEEERWWSWSWRRFWHGLCCGGGSWVQGDIFQRLAKLIVLVPCFLESAEDLRGQMLGLDHAANMLEVCKGVCRKSLVERSFHRLDMAVVVYGVLVLLQYRIYRPGWHSHDVAVFELHGGGLHFGQRAEGHETAFAGL